MKGEASEYGERFRVSSWERPSFEIGAAPSPSGDFVATLTTYKDDVDIALLSTKSRKLWKNLSPGRTTKYEYISAQFLTQGPESGRDLSFAPDGDRIAVFARRERGRQLFIFSARGGGVVARIPVAPDMPLSPAFSPDGRSVVFSGISGTSRDIFLLDLESKAVRNLTVGRRATTPRPSSLPTGSTSTTRRSSAASRRSSASRVDDPSKVEQVTWGEGNDDDAAFSPDGSRLYFASSRGGIFNIYGQDLATGELVQYTDVIGAALGPASYIGPDGQEKVVFSGYQAGRFQLYVADAKKPYKRLEEKALPPAPIVPRRDGRVRPGHRGRRRPREGREGRSSSCSSTTSARTPGVNSDGTFVSSARLSFSDYLGDRRAVLIWDTLAGYSNINAIYFNLKRRLQWGLQAYDNRIYFLGVNQLGELVSDRGSCARPGSTSSASTPSRATRGWRARSASSPGRSTRRTSITNADGTQGQIVLPRSDDTLQASVGFGYDATRYKSFGPHGGQALSVNYRYLPDFKDGGTLSRDLTAEARVYVPISRRTNLAFRAFGGASTGAVPTVYAFGGLDTLRGYDYRTLIGNRIAYLNAEFRFPLIDVLITGIGLNFGGVRGRVFLDVGGAWLEGEDFQVDRRRPPEGRARRLGRRLHRLLPRDPLEHRLRPALRRPGRTSAGGRRPSTSAPGRSDAARPEKGDRSHPGPARPRPRIPDVRVRVLGAYGGSYAVASPDVVPPRRHRRPRRGRADAVADARGAGAGPVDRRDALAPRPRRVAPVPRRERLRADGRAHRGRRRRRTSPRSSRTTSSTTPSGPTSRGSRRTSSRR